MTSGYKFLLYSINYAPELTGIGKYNGDMAAWLSDAGCQVDVICAPPYYPEWRVQKPYRSWSYRKETQEGIRVTRCPLYVPKRPSTIKRILHLSSFAITSGMALLSRLFSKPDVVFVVQPTLFVLPLTILYCKLTGAKSVLHIQDYEIDAMFGLELGGRSRSRTVQRVAEFFETRLMRQFDVVSTISACMMEKAQAKGVASDRLLFFPNWSDTDFVTPSSDSKKIRDLWQIQDDEKVVLYSGNLGEKQGLEYLLEVAQRFEKDTKVRFFIVGSGASAEVLEREASRLGLKNVEFKGLLEWDDVPGMLAAADVHLVLQKRGVCDAVLPSKLTNILSAGGHAVVTALPKTELGLLAKKMPGIYTCIEPENADALEAGIRSGLRIATEQQYNTLARDYALQHLNRNAVILRYFRALERLGLHTTALART